MHSKFICFIHEQSPSIFIFYYYKYQTYVRQCFFDKNYTEKVNINEIKLPLKENQVVGNIEIYDGDKQVGTYPLIVKEAVKKKNIFKLFLDNLKDIVVGDLVF